MKNIKINNFLFNKIFFIFELFLTNETLIIYKMNNSFLTPDYVPDQSRRERSMSVVEGVSYEELK
jgi:hypothetical protein